MVSIAILCQCNLLNTTGGSNLILLADANRRSPTQIRQFECRICFSKRSLKQCCQCWIIISFQLLTITLKPSFWDTSTLTKYTNFTDICIHLTTPVFVR